MCIMSTSEVLEERGVKYASLILTNDGLGKNIAMFFNGAWRKIGLQADDL
jgi:hypothetical protein